MSMRAKKKLALLIDYFITHIKARSRSREEGTMHMLVEIHLQSQSQTAAKNKKKGKKGIVQSTRASRWTGTTPAQ